MPIQEFHPLQTIDLSQQNGNVFALLGIVSRLAPTFDKNFKEISTEMISADYANAVFVFNREFGDFFNIILPPHLEITDSSGNVSVIKEKNHLKFTVSYANQDGFEFIISENLLSHMYQPDWNKHLTDYVSKTLDEAFTKVQSEFIPLMSPVLIPKKTKMTKTELEKQAQMLGYKLVKN